MIRQGDGLDGLSEDLWKIIKNPTTSWLYTQALFLDCCDLLRLETYYEFRKEQIQDELGWLIKDIQRIITEDMARFVSKPIALYLEIPNVLIVDYVPVETSAFSQIHRRIEKHGDVHRGFGTPRYPTLPGRFAILSIDGTTDGPDDHQTDLRPMFVTSCPNVNHGLSGILD